MCTSVGRSIGPPVMLSFILIFGFGLIGSKYAMYTALFCFCLTSVITGRFSEQAKWALEPAGMGSKPYSRLIGLMDGMNLDGMNLDGMGWEWEIWWLRNKDNRQKGGRRNGETVIDEK